MPSRFVSVSVQEWDNSKVSLETKDGRINILYDGLVPMLKICGNSDQPYLLTSKKGLMKATKYDSIKNMYTKEFAGSWTISFKIADDLSTIKPPPEGVEDKRSENDKTRYKIIEIYNHIKKMVAKATEDMVTDPISYKKLYSVSKLGNKKVIGIDEQGYAYLSMKVGYTAPPDAPTFKDRDRDVPIFGSRVPKATFKDLARAKNDLIVHNPELDCACPMKAIPRTTLCVNKGPKGYVIATNIFDIYYERDDSIGGGDDTDDVLKLVHTRRELFDEIPE